MSKNYYDRSYEAKLVDLLKENSIEEDILFQEFLNYFSSDDTCAFLESVCDDYDIPYEED